MKKINLTIFAPDPERVLSKGLNYIVDIQDNGTIIDAISNIDKKIMTNPEQSIFPLFKGLIHNYLQLIAAVLQSFFSFSCFTSYYNNNHFQ